MTNTSTVNVICMKWGNKYTSIDVNTLYSMVKRNLTIPFRFICLTDDKKNIRKQIECFEIPKISVPKSKEGSPWRKLALFTKTINDIKGKTLFLDLDIVIIDNIDCFFDFSDKLTIIENWTQKGKNIGNSSVYCFEFGKYPDLFEYFNNNSEKITKEFKNEQIFLSKYLKDIDFWPENWCTSFKRHCIPRNLLRFFLTPKKPLHTKIIVFHGRPKPIEAAHGGFYGNFYKYVKPARWILKYWY